MAASPEGPPGRTGAGDPLFRLDDVTVTRGRGTGHVHPLSGVTLSVLSGRCTGLVGPSGAGKTTMLRLLDRMEEPAAGRVLFHDVPLPAYDVLDLRRRVGLVQQAPVLLGDSVLEDLRVGRPQLSEEAALDLLDRVALPAEFLTRATAGLSGGEAQRLCLARALAVGPEVLLLDEPTSALDSFAAAAVERVLRSLVGDGLTVVLVSHDLRQARRLADELVVVVSGTVAAEGPAGRIFADAGDERARAFLVGAS